MMTVGLYGTFPSWRGLKVKVCRRRWLPGWVVQCPCCIIAADAPTFDQAIRMADFHAMTEHFPRRGAGIT